MVRIIAILTVLISASPQYSFGKSDASGFPSFTIRSSCFDGVFTNNQTYGTYLADLRAQKKITHLHEERLKVEYLGWIKDFECAYFDYMVDGFIVTGFYAKPTSSKETLTPVIFNRGGNADGVFKSQYIYHKIFPLVEAGFIVFGSFYRGAAVNGVPSPDRLADQFGGDDVNDVLALLPIIDTFKDVRSDKIGLWGVSRGGMMSFLSASKSKRFAAIATNSAPVNLVREEESTRRMDKVFQTWIPDYKDKKRERLEERSAIYWHEKLEDVPILLLQGAKESRVMAENTIEFALKLQRSKQPFELILYKDGVHGLRRHEAEIKQRITAWFKTHLSY